ncbi:MULTISPECIES: NAD(P)-dependent oxidoreductase [Nocardiaceae]|uniref:NAD(P)-dependent oxidoreductase n=1 Tax=Nocardiaceae TaxID=85025 RepID=UPI000A7E387F|nr:MULTISPECIES: NAD(P)-dependent oxidoreductase [Rhodococcus]
MQHEMESVAVLGVGAMGAPMARRLASAGYAVTVCDRNVDALDSFAGVATTVSTDPRSCASADAVLVLVATAAQVAEVLVGDHGVFAGDVGERPPVVVVMSTVGPEHIRELRQGVARYGAGVVDAPVSGGVNGAENGTLSVFLGGDPATVDSIEPVLKHLGDRLFRCGGVGDAQTVKMVNNAIAVVNAHVGAEAFRFAVERGLLPAAVAPVLEASSGRNLLTVDSRDVATMFAEWTASRPDFDALTSIMAKDLRLVAELTEPNRLHYPVLGRLPDLVGAIGDDTFDTWRKVAAGASSTQPDPIPRTISAHTRRPNKENR